MNFTMNFTALKTAVATARRESYNEARTLGRRGEPRSTFRRAVAYGEPRMPFTRSRGTFLCTADKDGQASPNVAAECPEWGGTKREIVELVARVTAEYPNVTSIYIEGGYDISETMDFDDYEPSVSSWEVTVWTRDGGYAL